MSAGPATARKFALAPGFSATPGCGVNDWWCHGTCRRHGECMYIARDESPATFAGSHLQPPPPRPPTATPADAEPLPDGPTEAEQEALRALPIAARKALCACRGPGWTVYASGVAVPRLKAPSPDLVGVAVVGWLPASEEGILCAVVNMRRRRQFCRLNHVLVEIGKAETTRHDSLRTVGLRMLASEYGGAA